MTQFTELTRLVTRLELSMLDETSPAPGSEPRHAVRLSLYHRDDPIGEWRVTTADVRMPTTPLEVAAMRARLAGRRNAVVQALPGLMAPYVHAFARRMLSEVHAEVVRYHYRSDSALPLHVAREMGAALRRHDLYGCSLWVSIAEPPLYLSFVNWERLLAPVCGGPVVRLPYFPVDPLCASTSLEVLLCYPGNAVEGAPVDARKVRSLCDAIFRGVGDRPCTIHAFTDAPSYARLFRPTIGTVDTVHRVRYYDPARAGAAARKPTRRRSNSRTIAKRRREQVDHPWMSWIRDALAGQAVDVCHIVAPGELLGGDASLVIPELPVPRRDRKGKPVATAPRLVTASYLAAVLQMVGAPAAIVSSPGGGVSRIATRALGDQVARRQPAALAIHDLERDPSLQNLAATYAFLADPRPTRPPSGTDLTLYCHPSQVIDVPDVPLLADETLGEAVRAARAVAREVIDRPGPAPAWLASTHRVLDQAIAGYLARNPVTDREHAEQEGLRSALEFVSGVLAQRDHVESAVRQSPRELL